jgi:hypothetical protein
MQLTALNLFYVCAHRVNACGDYVGSILPVVLYGCETWSLILREEDNLKVFENRLLRIISGP